MHGGPRRWVYQSPGPWESAVTNEFTKIFDPTVFVDDGGQAYIYGNDHWVDIGDPGRHMMGAKLKDNMIELDSPRVRISKEEVNEAVHVFKRNGIYYFSARVGKVTKYGMADSPLPQYAELKGELASNSPDSPNHISAIEFEGEWYLFYHRGDVNHGSSCRRSACFDKMTFREDGTIEPIVYTLDDGTAISKTKNAKPPRKVSVEPNDPPVPKKSSRHQAEDFTEQAGVRVEHQPDGGGSTGLAVSNGGWARYDFIPFGNNADADVSFRVRAAALGKGGVIELRLDRLDGKAVGTIAVSAEGGEDGFKTLSTTLRGVAGVRTIYLRFTGGSGELMKLNWFEWTAGRSLRIKKEQACLCRFGRCREVPAVFSGRRGRCAEK